jgi:hypothetical protein
MNRYRSCARDSFLQSRNCQTGRVPQQSWGFTPINYVLLDMTINYFNELPSFKVADNGYKLLVSVRGQKL